MIRSIWEETSTEITEFVSIQGNQEADVVIIGGGITGLTAAHLLANAGKDVILIEARKIGLGTSGNSTGNLYATVDEHLHSIKNKWNKEVFHGLVRSRAAAINEIEKIATANSIECDFIRTSFNHFCEAANEDFNDFFERETEALREAGLNPVVGEGNLPFEVNKMLTIQGQAQFHPLKYCRGLAKNLSKKCRIYENSAMLDYDDDKGIVKTAGGTIRANHILMATHTPKGIHFVHTKIAPYREFGIAAELKSGNCPEGIFWGLDSPKHSIRKLSTNGKNYVMVVGDKFKTGQETDLLKYRQKLVDFLSGHFDIHPPEFFWGGQHYRSADSLPFIGKHGEHTYLLTGFATDGLVYGTLGAMLVSDAITGKENEFSKIFNAERSAPVKSAIEFIKENANVLMQYFKDVPGIAEVDELKEILPGQGKIIEFEGEKFGAYRDQDQRIHLVSAVCTHMKCIVKWNEAEISWDCPCHGSRFDISGKVLEGPAITDLGKLEQ